MADVGSHQDKFDEYVSDAKARARSNSRIVKVYEDTPPRTEQDLIDRTCHLMLLRDTMFFLGKDLPEHNPVDRYKMADIKHRASELWHWGYYGDNPVYPNTLHISSQPFYEKGQAEVDWMCGIDRRAFNLELDRIYAFVYNQQSSGFGWAEVEVGWK